MENEIQKLKDERKALDAKIEEAEKAAKRFKVDEVLASHSVKLAEAKYSRLNDGKFPTKEAFEAYESETLELYNKALVEWLEKFEKETAFYERWKWIERVLGWVSR